MEMPDLSAIPHKWDAKTRECRAVIETPKGRRNKFDYNPDLESFELGGLLPEGMSFPFDFGFIPSTMGDDGDPVDVMVLMDEPAHVGCILDIRVIGAIEGEQIENGKSTTNNRLIAVAVHSYSHQDLSSIDDVNKVLLDQLEEFFVNYNKSRGKKFKVQGRCGPRQASKLVESGIKKYAKKHQ